MSHRALAILAAALCGSVPATARADCAARLLPDGARAVAGPVTAEALIALRDFGDSDNGAGAAPPFAVSPDRAWAALIMRRADPAANTYCVGVVLVPLHGQSGPRLLDMGGEYIAATNDIRGIPGIVNGSPAHGAPIWSPDGRWLIYRRRDDGVTRIWRAGLAGDARVLPGTVADVTSFGWTADGRSVLISSRPALADAAREIEREGEGGFHYDGRFWALSESWPRPALPLAATTIAVDVARGTVTKGIEPGVRAPRPAGPAGLGARWRATLESDPAHPYGPVRFRLYDRGRPVACPPAICGDGVVAFWWRSAGELLFQRGGSPENGGQVEFYRWRPATARSPRLLFATRAAVFGCQPSGRTLLCAYETAVRPRTLVRLDPDAGRVTTIFDPNPDYAGLPARTVTRLRWGKDAAGATYGDLVLPPGHRPGQQHPLVVVQYQSRGFLRGGTGDEYPIPLLAASGYAVLSFQRPALLVDATRALDLDAVQRINIADWAERRMIVAALEAGIDAAIGTHTIDAAHIGVTGLSDGSTSVQFLLAHSNRIAAAAVSSCCSEPSGRFVAGPAYGDALARWGYPAKIPDPAFWQPMSLAANAARLRTPLLIQTADSEFRLALESYATLRDAGAPVDMYVFPGEHHVKVQPEHRLAVYRRTLAWFDFWLRGQSRPPTATAAELVRWRFMQARR